MKRNTKTVTFICFLAVLFLFFIPTNVIAKGKSGDSFSSFIRDVYCGIFYKTDESCHVQPRTVEESSNKEVAYTLENDTIAVFAADVNDDNLTPINMMQFQVVGAQGPKGDKGDKGDTGSQGPKGDKGDPVYIGNDGNTVVQGSKGDKGDRGVTGAQGLKGDKGDPGTSSTYNPGSGIIIDGLNISTSLGITIESNEIADGAITLSKISNEVCQFGEIFKFNGNTWQCSSDNVGDVTAGNIITTSPGIVIEGGTGAILGSGVTINIANASSSQTGLLSANDWNTFNNGISSKLDKTLNNGMIFVGNSSNNAVGVTVSGDVTINNSGVTTIGIGKITNDMLAGSINPSKLSVIDVAGKVAGSAIQLVSSGGLEDAIGLRIKLNGNTLGLSEAGLSLNLGSANTWTALQTFNNGINMGVGSNINANSNKIINVGTPTDPNDAANKAYIDSFVSGITWQNPVVDIA